MTSAVMIYTHEGRKRNRLAYTREGMRMLNVFLSLGWRVIAYGTEEGALAVHLSV